MKKNTTTIFNDSDCLTKDEIARYILQKGDKALERRVEHHINSCELCSGAMEAYQQDPSLLNRKSSIEEIGIRERKVVSLISAKWFLTIAASLGLILVSIYGIHEYKKLTQNDKLFSQYHQVLAMDEGTNTRGSNSISELTLDNLPIDIAEDYNQSKYEIALQKLDNLANSKPRAEELIFWRGMCYLELENYTKAISYFEDARMNGKVYFDDASWFLALSYVKTKDFDSAKQILNDIQDSPSSNYKTKAKNLLEQLN
jgi:tetratricopeptide (TPR) repeat protein